MTAGRLLRSEGLIPSTSLDVRGITKVGVHDAQRSQTVGDWPTMNADQSPEDVPGQDSVPTSSSWQPSSSWPSSWQPSSSPFRITSSRASSARRFQVRSPQACRRPPASRPGRPLSRIARAMHAASQR